jgi:molybdopterin/thiamine biosynthesis adenylyltransferase
VKEFEEAVNKLDKPTNYLPQPKKKQNKKQPRKKKDQSITEGQAAIEDVDVGTDSEDEKSIQIDTSSKKKHGKDINIDDDAVKDRWSRYIGAMGVEAVAKQAAANIFVSGAGALGVEISKNLVLSGCKSFTLHDTQPITRRDLSGQFFLNMVEGKTRSEVCLPRLQQLNFYVRCKLAPTAPIPLDASEYEKEPWNFQGIDVFILTEADYKTVVAVNNYCRAKGKKFIYADIKGVFGRVFNDFGEGFEVLDKNGEELQDCMIKSITNEEEAVVTLLDTNKHNLEDGDEIMFTNVEGMKLKEGEK